MVSSRRSYCKRTLSKDAANGWMECESEQRERDGATGEKLEEYLLQYSVLYSTVVSEGKMREVQLSDGAQAQPCRQQTYSYYMHSTSMTEAIKVKRGV